MGMVLAFAPRKSAFFIRQKAAGELAPVIIFPGVRYERLSLSSEPAVPGDGLATTQIAPTKAPAR